MEEKKSIFRPIKNGSVAKIVMEQIKNALLEKSLKPGDRLPTEAELCKSLGVGKSSIREAIKMLDVLGVVQTRQGDGTYISSSIPENSLNPLVYQLLIDYGNNADILELRAMFEPAYTILAMRNATPADKDRLVEVNRRFKKKVADGIQTANDDLKFHRAILEATHNPFVIRIGFTVLQLFESSIGDSMKQIPEQALEDHDRILVAFLKGDEAEVREAVHKSFEGWTTIMQEKRTLEKEMMAI